MEEPHRVEELQRVLSLLGGMVLFVEKETGLVYQSHRAYRLVLCPVELLGEVGRLVDIVALEREVGIQKLAEIYRECGFPCVGVAHHEDDVLVPQRHPALELLRQTFQSVYIDRKAVVCLHLGALELASEPWAVYGVCSHQSSSRR